MEFGLSNKIVTGRLSLCLLVLFLGTTGCVSSSKFGALEKNHSQLEQQHATLTSDHKKGSERVVQLETLVASLEKRLGEASSDKDSLKTSIQQMKVALSEASQRKADTEKRLGEYRYLLNRFRTLINAGQLSVKIVDGRMVVALPSDVLFASGSARLSAKGQASIKKVAQLLKTIPERKFQIEGHTDNVPIRTSTYPSNWELASSRALTVLKQMIAGGLPSGRVSAASFADTRPYADNSNAAGKSTNRRIEIVVVPDLSSLPGYEELKALEKKSQ